MSKAFWSTDMHPAGYVGMKLLSLDEQRLVEEALIAYTAVLPKGHVDRPALAELRTSLKETPW